MNARKVVMDEKEQFIKTMRYEHAIRSAVARGFYYASGGKKTIALPGFCDIVTEAVQKVLKAKELYENKESIKAGEYANELARAFKVKGKSDLIQEVEFGFEVIEVDGTEWWSLVITDFMGGKIGRIRRAGKLNNSTLIKLLEQILIMFGSPEVLQYVQEARIAFMQYYGAFN